MAVDVGGQVPRRVWSSRIRSELVDWAEGYAERRGVSRSVIAEAAVEHFRGLCESGVPDLPEREAVPRRRKPEAVVPEPTPIRAAVNPRKSSVTKEEYAELMRERDRILAEARATVVRRGS